MDAVIRVAPAAEAVVVRVAGGERGPAGPPGTGSTYVHTQSTPSAVWTITHNLARRLSVTVVDSTDRVVLGEVRYPSDNQITVTFSAAFSGAAYLN